MSTTKKHWYVADPIHQMLEFGDYETHVRNLVGSASFQRLRRITQLGLASYVFPGAVHTAVIVRISKQAPSRLPRDIRHTLSPATAESFESAWVNVPFVSDWSLVSSSVALFDDESIEDFEEQWRDNQNFVRSWQQLPQKGD